MPAIGVPIIDANPWNNKIKPNADVKLSSPRMSTKTIVSRTTKLVKNPKIETTTAYNSYEVQNGSKSTEIPLKNIKTLYTKNEFTWPKSENHPVNNFPMIFAIAVINKLLGSKSVKI